MSKKWSWNYPNYMDWEISLTEEMEGNFSDCSDEADTFSEAKKALIKRVKEDIENHKMALRQIRKCRKPKKDL